MFVQSLAGIMRRDIEGREAELNPVIARNISRVAAELYTLSDASGKTLALGLDPTRGQSLMYADEVVDFWEKYLLTVGLETVREALGGGAGHDFRAGGVCKGSDRWPEQLMARSPKHKTTC